MKNLCKYSDIKWKICGIKLSGKNSYTSTAAVKKKFKVCDTFVPWAWSDMMMASVGGLGLGLEQLVQESPQTASSSQSHPATP